MNATQDGKEPIQQTEEMMERVRQVTEGLPSAGAWRPDPFLDAKYVAHALARQDGRTMNPREMMSLRALMTYASFRQGLALTALEQILCDLHVVGDVMEIPAQSYDDVMRFLVDFSTDAVRH